MLKIRAASICHSDVQIIRGIVYVQGTVTLGYEIAGDLEEAGININSIKKADRAVVRFLTPCHNRHLYLTGKSSSCKNIYSAPLYGFSADGGYAEYISR